MTSQENNKKMREQHESKSEPLPFNSDKENWDFSIETRLLISSFLYSRRPSQSLDRPFLILVIDKESLPYWICSGLIKHMSDDIGNVSGNAQMMLANQEPGDCGTEAVGLVLNEGNLMQKRLGGCTVIDDVSLQMFRQMLVAGEVKTVREE